MVNTQEYTLKNNKTSQILQVQGRNLSEVQCIYQISLSEQQVMEGIYKPNSS